MRSSILCFILLMITLGLSGQLHFGAGIDTNSSAFGLSGKGHIEITDYRGGQIGFNWYLNDSNPSRLDIDATYLLTTAGDSDEITLKGLGYFNYWSSGVQSISSELGINIDANITFPIEDKLFYVKPKFSIINVGDFFIGAGMY